MLTNDKLIQVLECRKALRLKADSMAAEVLNFMVAFNQLPTPSGELVAMPDIDLAEKLIKEEVEEMVVGFEKFRKSQTTENLVELVDGAVDSIYVILWMLNKFNAPTDDCFAEVQRSNMAKLNSDGTYTKNAAGKVQKPASWTPPDLLSIIINHKDKAQWKGGLRTHQETTR